MEFLLSFIHRGHYQNIFTYIVLSLSAKTCRQVHNPSHPLHHQYTPTWADTWHIRPHPLCSLPALPTHWNGVSHCSAKSYQVSVLSRIFLEGVECAGTLQTPLPPTPMCFPIIIVSYVSFIKGVVKLGIHLLCWRVAPPWIQLPHFLIVHYSFYWPLYIKIVVYKYSSHRPPTPTLCAIEGCGQIKKYSDSFTKLPLCSLQCYQQLRAREKTSHNTVESHWSHTHTYTLPLSYIMYYVTAYLYGDNHK